MKLFQFSQNRQGIALIIVLIVTIVLGILVGGFAYSMKVETKLARNASFDAELEWMGRSGIELARYVLAQSGKGPQGQYDALNQVWAGGPGDDTNDIVSQIPLKNYQLGRGTISLDIKDLDRKFNINVADDVILRQALTLVGVDASVFPTIVDSIRDWIDPDDDTHLSGSESDHYKSLSPPHFAKNGPIDDIMELLMINGITPSMFYGSSGGAGQELFSAPQRSNSNFEEPTYTTGLRDLFTPMSGQRVNLNTAGPMVLQLIPEIDETVAAAIISGPLGRAGPDGSDGTLDDTPFKNISEIIRVPGMNPNAVALLNRYFSVRSAVFEVTIDVVIDNMKRQYVAILRRGGNARDVQLLYMYWK